MADVRRVALAARAFTLAATISLAALLGPEVLRGALLVVVVAVWAQVFSLSGRIPEKWVVICEGAVIGLIGAIMWPDSDGVTPYLVVPVLIGGLAAGLGGMLRVLATEAGSTTAAWVVLDHSVDRSTVAQVFLWLVAAMGLGLLGIALRRTMVHARAGAPYRDALDLIKQLHALSGRLTAGLDAVNLAEEIMQASRADLSYIQAMVVARTASGGLAPLRFSDGASTATLLSSLEWLENNWELTGPILRGSRVALPLRAEEQVVAMLVVDCLRPPDPRSLEHAHSRLGDRAVQLHAAMLFSDIRDTATSEERQRLAREVHDGVAQDVASLGYVVDNLVDNAEDADQLELLKLLRREVTRVVTELRHSVFDLRNEVGAGQGLGQSLSSFARHIGSHSDLTVHVTLDEAATRLRPQVESELLRIAQEAINNARKHSGGRNLWVSCSVQPPEAKIEVRDDGDGLGPGREDSHGLRIMRERAQRIGADLQVDTPAQGGRGTRVFVRVPARARSLSEA